jgi:AAA domain
MSINDLDAIFNYVANDYDEEGYSDSSKKFRSGIPTRKQAIIANAIWHANQDREFSSTLSICLGINKNFNHPPLGEHIVSDLVLKTYEDSAQHLQGKNSKKFELDLNSGRLTYVESSPARDFLFGSDLIPLHTVSIIGGNGGTGKSMALSYMTAHSACGLSFSDRTATQVCSLVLAFEDDQNELNARYSAIMANFTDNQKTLVQENIRAISLVGKSMQLVTMKGRNTEATGMSDILIEKLLELKSKTGLSNALLVLDHARLVATLDWNDSGQISVLTRELHKIAHEAEATVLLVAHSPKTTLSANHVTSQADIAGSSALVDNLRHILIVRGMNQDEAKSLGIKEDHRKQYTKIECVKSNYSETGHIGWFKRDRALNHPVGTLTHVNLVKTTPTKIGDTADESKLIKYIKANSDLTLTELRARAGKKTPLGLSDLVVQKLVNKLLNDGLLIYVEPSASYTKKRTNGFKGVLGVADGI